jgi:hypothetical protein
MTKRISPPKPSGSKRIKPPSHNAINKESTNTLHPAFCFRYVDRNYSISQCDKDAKVALANKIQELSQITWDSIQKAPRHGVGHEIIEQASINKPLPANTPEDRNFLSFRLGNGKNSVIIGYRKDKIFYVIWVDPNGDLYKH